MIEKIMDKYVAEVIKELSEQQSEEAKKLAEFLKKECIEINDSRLFHKALGIVSGDYISGMLDGDEVDSALALCVLMQKEQLKAIRDRYVFRVDLQGYGQHIYRVLSIPQSFLLSDLGIAIVLAFRGDFYHLMRFVIKGKEYSIYHEDEYELDARDYTLKELKLSKSTKIEFEYDFGAGWDFKVKLLEKIKDEDSLYPIRVLEGEGYGILEDEPYFLELLRTDPNTSIKKYTGQDISVREYAGFDFDEFDLDDTNHYIEDFFDECKYNCEHPEDFD